MDKTKKTKLAMLGKKLNYPDVIGEDVENFTFLIDDLAIDVSSQSRGTMFRFYLSCSEDLFSDFAKYAAGRFLREEATLAFDDREGKLFLWQIVENDVEDSALFLAFENFVNACEWWQGRCAEMEVPQNILPDIMIRP